MHSAPTSGIEPANFRPVPAIHSPAAAPNAALHAAGHPLFIGIPATFHSSFLAFSIPEFHFDRDSPGIHNLNTISCGDRLTRPTDSATFAFHAVTFQAS
jgi:hypothetical protein